MPPVTEEARLHAVRAGGLLAAADAVAWFGPGARPGRQVIGYTLSARAATWLLVGRNGTVESTGDVDRVLTETYEMVLFDGERELRWLRTPDGRGHAVAVGEEPSALPPGHDVTAAAAPTRGDIHVRLLAGAPRPHTVAGWTTLGGNRYTSVAVPAVFADGDVPAVEFVEYLTEDEHGNLDVVDTRTLRLRAATRQPAADASASASTCRKGTLA